jgi:hypothetical protein
MASAALSSGLLGAWFSNCLAHDLAAPWKKTAGP